MSIAALGVDIGRVTFIHAGAAESPAVPTTSALHRFGNTGEVASISDFLKAADIDVAFASVFEELGYSDVESISDKELLDDQTLAGVIGMDKVSIRKLRAHIELSATSPTMMHGRRAMAVATVEGGKPQKRDFQSKETALENGVDFSTI